MKFILHGRKGREQWAGLGGKENSEDMVTQSSKEHAIGSEGPPARVERLEGSQQVNFQFGTRTAPAPVLNLACIRFR